MGLTSTAQRNIARPKPDEVHLWLLPEYPDHLARLRGDGLALLSPEEVSRFDGMKHRGPADGFLLGRVLLRRVLALYLETRPEMLAFDIDVHGKPALADRSLPIHFNLSHSGSDVVLAVTCCPAIGIDLESLERRDTAHRIACQFFSQAERRCIATLGPAGALHALMLWSFKEAIVKAEGGSLWSSLEALSLSIDCPRVNLLSPPQPGDFAWKLAGGLLRERCFLAVATKEGRSGYETPCRFQTYEIDGPCLDARGFQPQLTSWPQL